MRKNVYIGGEGLLYVALRSKEASPLIYSFLGSLNAVQAVVESIRVISGTPINGTVCCQPMLCTKLQYFLMRLFFTQHQQHRKKSLW